MPGPEIRRIDPSWWVLAGIFAVNAILKVVYFSGLCQADDFSYGVYAYSFFRLPLPWDMTLDFRALRLALLLPVSVLFRIMGTSEFAAVLYPTIVSFGTLLLVFAIGRRVAGTAAGLFAAGVFAIFPGDVIYGTMLLPDVLAPFYMTAAVWAFLKGDASSGRAQWWWLGAGVSMFLAFNARENSYWFLFFFLPFAFDAARWKKGLWAAAAGFAVPIVMLYSFYALKSGDFFYNLHVAESQRDPLLKSGYIPRNADNWLRCLQFMLPAIRELPNGERMWASSLFGWTFYLGIPCVAYAALKGLFARNRWLLAVSWWFLAGYLFLEFGSISFDRYQMMLKLPRFLITITPAMAVGCGIALADAFGFGRKHPVRPAAEAQKEQRKGKEKPPVRAGRAYRFLTIPIASVLILFMAITSLAAMKGQSESLDRNMAPFRWGGGVLRDLPRKPIYGTGGWWNNKLSFFLMPDIRFADMPWRRSDMLRDLKAVKNPSELAGSYIVLDRTNFTGENDLRIRHDYADFGPWVLLPPKEWKLLGAKYRTEIYEVPEGWTYAEPDGVTLVRGSVLHALKSDEFMLFYYNLHPEFLATLNEQSFWGLFNGLKSEVAAGRADAALSRAEYRDFNGRMKILFKAN